jgi:hypothetical protein
MQNVIKKEIENVTLERVKERKMETEPKIIAKKKIKIIIANNYIRDSVVEAPRGAAEHPQAQSIRSRPFRYLQRVKSHAPQRMMQPKITATFK